MTGPTVALALLSPLWAVGIEVFARSGKSQVEATGLLSRDCTFPVVLAFRGGLEGAVLPLPSPELAGSLLVAHCGAVLEVFRPLPRVTRQVVERVVDFFFQHAICEE